MKLKRICALLLAAALVLALSACGSSKLADAFEAGAERVTSAPSGTSGTEPSAVPDSKAEVSAAPSPAAAAASPEPAVPTETVETPLWTLTYPAEAGWTYSETDDLTAKDESCKLEISQLDAEGKVRLSVEIRAAITTPYSFRSDLKSYGFDEYAYAVDQAYDTVDVGGVQCLSYEGTSWGSPVLRYLQRIEGANETVWVEIEGDDSAGEAAELLSGLSFHVTDIGNVDGPWYWNGTPFSAGTLSAAAGSNTLTAEWLVIDPLYRTDETFYHDVAVVGSDVYLLDETVLRHYTMSADGLTYADEMDLGNDYRHLAATNDGTLIVSGFIRNTIAIKNGQQVADYGSYSNYLAVAPSGTWGVGYFTKGSDVKKVTFSGGAMTETDLPLNEVGTIMHLSVDENHIYACGSPAEGGSHTVFVYDTNGTLQLKLEGIDTMSLGSVTAVWQTASGYLALDGNMRRVVCWQSDGTYICNIDDSALFGTSYPWFCSATPCSDGSLLCIMTEERADKSCDELIAYRLSGW